MRVKVHITLKNGVLDPQGKAIEHALHNLGFDGVKDVTQGKVIAFEVPDNTEESDIRDMCEKLLANPVIEDYKIDLAG